MKTDVWDVLRRLPGSESREALDLIYVKTRSVAGIVVLSEPSARMTGAAVLAALGSLSSIGPVRVYLVDTRRGRLLGIFGELARLGLACEVTLYHGSLTQFLADVPLSPDLICTDSIEIPEVRPIITRNALCRASSPTGKDFVPSAGARVRLQGKLHQRYFCDAATDVGHTFVTDLTGEIQRELSSHMVTSSGWPYRPSESPLPPTLPSGREWPKISIITPTLNQGRYLEETILSVLHQGYPNVEHIIVDGASTDDTRWILKRYRDKLSLVISEPDRGQSDAINKGMSRASGEILTWLNGDDMLAPGALAAVAQGFDANDVDMIAGICEVYRDDSLESQHLTSCADGQLRLEELLDLDRHWHAGRFFIQPEVMFTREMWQRAGGRVNEMLHYTMDYDLWLRFANAGARLRVIRRPVARFRLHEEQKISARHTVARELRACRDAFIHEKTMVPQR